MNIVVRLTSALKTDFQSTKLKELIFKSKGRIIIRKFLLFAGTGLIRGVNVFILCRYSYVKYV